MSELGLNVEAADKGLWRLRGYEQQFMLRPDNRTYTLNSQVRQAPTAPVLVGSDLYIPVQILLQPFGFTVEHGDRWNIATPAAGVTGVRQGTHPDRVRYVVDLTAPALFRWYEEPGKLIVEFPATPDQQGRSNMLRLHEFDDALSEQVTESLSDGFERLVFAHASTQPPQIFTLHEPARVVIDLLRGDGECKQPAQVAEVPKPAPGDIWDTRVFTGSKGPVRGFVIRFNPRTTAWKLRPALAATTVMQRSTVSNIVGRANAYGGINGGYFSTLGPPLGMLVVDGEWIKGPLYSRAVLGISKTGQYAIAQTDFTGSVEFAGLGCLPLDAINEGHSAADGIVVYNRRWGQTVCGAPGRTRLVVNKDGVVTLSLVNGEDAQMPEGGFVISGAGARAEALRRVQPGMTAALHMDTNPPWPNLLHAVGGGPILVVDGKVCVNSGPERFRSDVAYGSHPRSAVGIATNGDIILLAVQRPGLTLTELAAVLVKLGAKDAMNLDGGGSTTLVVKGKVLNAPADGCQRAVSNALLVVKG